MTARVYHARVVLPISSPPITGGAVAVAGDRITWVGRAGDAVVAARLLSPGPQRDRRLAETERAVASVRCH